MTTDDFFGEAIHVYTREQAVEDGALVKLETTAGVPVFATTNCFHRAGLDNPLQRRGVILEALAALRKHDPEDSCSMKLRVLHQGIAADYECLWAVLDEEALTIMFPEDY